MFMMKINSSIENTAKPCKKDCARERFVIQRKFSPQNVLEAKLSVFLQLPSQREWILKAKKNSSQLCICVTDCGVSFKTVKFLNLKFFDL